MDSKAGVRWGSGREVQEGRDVHSRLIQGCCMAEANTILQSSYPPIRNKFFKKYLTSLSRKTSCVTLYLLLTIANKTPDQYQSLLKPQQWWGDQDPPRQPTLPLPDGSSC